MSVSEALRHATERLSATSGTARLDAELLMAHALGLPRSDMLLRAMAQPTPARFASFVERRAVHEPVAYITGQAEFYGLDLAVTPDVLIPRGDSETLIEAAREMFADREPGSVLDLGTGSGALLLAALSVWPAAFGCATDRSDAVVAPLLQNIRRHGDGRAIFFQICDWREEGWSRGFDMFDLVLCNPPYIEDEADLDPDVREYEPASALFAGPDGLDDYRILIPQLRALLTENGVAIFEIGHAQAESVGAIARQHGFATLLRHDLAGRPRALVLR